MAATSNSMNTSSATRDKSYAFYSSSSDSMRAPVVVNSRDAMLLSSSYSSSDDGDDGHQLPKESEYRGGLVAPVMPMALSSSSSLFGAVPATYAPASSALDQAADDEMSHWLVDICEQLGTEDAEQVSGGVKAGSSAVHVVPAPIAPVHTIDGGTSPSSSPSSDSSTTMTPLDARKPASARRPRTKKKSTATSTQGGEYDDDGRQQQLQEEMVGGSSAESRREKNRLRVRRHYYRKLSQMNNLRAQVSELEEKIQALRLGNASKQQQILQLGHGSVMIGDGESVVVVKTRQQQQLEQYIRQLDDAKKVLLQENQQVRSILYNQTHQFVAMRQHLIDESRYLATPFPVPFIVKRKLAPSECGRIWQNTKLGLSQLLCEKSSLSNCIDNGGGSSGGDICGWKTTRVVENGAFKFVFQKVMYNRTAEQMLDASWAVFKDPHGFAKLYSPTVKMWCSLVQIVDDDNVVLFQEHRSMDKDEVHVMMKTILLASRVKLAASNDFSITMRGLEHDQLLLEELSVSEREGYEVWNDINTWLQWIPRGEHGEHCELKVSGAIPTVGANSYFWVIEVLLIVMRLEAATSGPIFQVLCK